MKNRTNKDSLPMKRITNTFFQGGYYEDNTFSPIGMKYYQDGSLTIFTQRRALFSVVHKHNFAYHQRTGANKLPFVDHPGKQSPDVYHQWFSNPGWQIVTPGSVRPNDRAGGIRTKCFSIASEKNRWFRFKAMATCGPFGDLVSSLLWRASLGMKDFCVFRK